MQGEVLSQREICFSATELHWQCLSMARCDCGLTSIIDPRFSSDPTHRLLMTQRTDGSVTRGLSSSSSTTRRRNTTRGHSWRRLVEEYTRRELTIESDRLTALAGVASKFDLPSGYLAGMWREDAALQLLWRGDNTAETRCRRRDSHYAPSWSWASLCGPVRFCTLNLGQWKYTSRTVWEVLDGWCWPRGANPLGPVARGELRIRGWVAPVVVVVWVGVSPVPLRYKYQLGGLYQWTQSGGSKSYFQLHANRLSAGTGRADVTQSRLTGVIGLDTDDSRQILIDGKTSRFCYLIAHTGATSGAILSVDMAKTMGLLIRESPEHKETWQRVCLVTPEGWFADWKTVAEEKIITLS